MRKGDWHMALDIKPTRSELINLKRRIKQTSSGYNLLKMKRDGLFHEFRTLLSEMIAAREELVVTFRDALQAINLASSIEGGLSVKSAAIAASKHPEVEVSRRNIMGVVVPKVEGQNLKLSAEDRGLGMVGGSPYIDEAADAYSLLVEKVVKAAEMEATLKRLLEEIEATKRRVNALEFKVIPEMKEAQTFIQLRLEEMEREETFRLKRFKNK
jgi:V/A-type H+-transporting ATPase subunit D